MDLNSPRHSAAGPREAGSRPRTPHARLLLRWRQRLLAHAPPPALLQVVPSGGGSGSERGKQKRESDADPPVQRRPRSPEASRKAKSQQADATRNTAGTSETKKTAAHPGPSARPAPEVTYRAGAGVALQSGFFLSHSSSFQSAWNHPRHPLPRVSRYSVVAPGRLCTKLAAGKGSPRFTDSNPRTATLNSPGLRQRV